MIKENYYMHKLIQKYYEKWLGSPTLMEHTLDRERFYRFVKACIRYSKHWNAKQDIHGGWLRYFLGRDLQERYNERYCDEIIHKAVVLFEHTLEFNKTTFPDHLVEMKNPFRVRWELRSWRRVDENGKGKPYYSDDEIDKILRDNFGPSWREKYGPNAIDYLT